MKKVVTALVFLFMGFVSGLVLANAQETQKIELIINGEVYERNYPLSLSESRTLIDDLVRMYNAIDVEYNALAVREAVSNDEAARNSRDIIDDIASGQDAAEAARLSLEELKTINKQIEKRVNALHFGVAGTYAFNGITNSSIGVQLALHKKSWFFLGGPLVDFNWDGYGNLFSIGFTLSVGRWINW